MISVDKVKELFTFDRESGYLVWKSLPQNISRLIGKKAGYKDSLGYIKIKFHGQYYLAHRLIWMYLYGAEPKGDIDHINGNPSDNHQENLRDVTHAMNMHNRRKPHKSNKCGYLGVSFCKRSNKYKACIRVDGKTKHIGLFATPELAHEAYLKTKRQLHSCCSI